MRQGMSKSLNEQINGTTDAYGNPVAPIILPKDDEATNKNMRNEDYVKGIKDRYKPIQKDDGAPVVTNAQGGKGSKLAVAYHLIPSCVLKALAKVYNYGAYVRPYGPWNWEKVEWWDHYNHLMEHLQNLKEEMGVKEHLDTDVNWNKIVDELEHALCRMSMMHAKIVGFSDERSDKQEELQNFIPYAVSTTSSGIIPNNFPCGHGHEFELGRSGECACGR